MIGLHTAQVTALCTHVGLGIAALSLEDAYDTLAEPCEYTVADKATSPSTVVDVCSTLTGPPAAAVHVCACHAGMKCSAQETDLHQIVTTR